MKKSNASAKNIIISGYYGFDNFGDEAILGVLIKKLKKLDINIRVLSKNPTKTKELYKVNTTLFFCLIQVILRISKCDILISGGGSLLQDVTSSRSLFYYLWVINTALFFNKKVIIFAQGIGPINSKFGALLTKQTLKKCSLVTVRDEKSLFLLRGWGINTNLVCDPLFDLKMKQSFPSNKIGVQLRSFKTLQENMLIKLAEQINKDFSDKEIEIYSFQDSLDLKTCQHFEKLLKALNPNIKTSLIFSQTSEQIIDKIAKLDYMIAMRFHANLIALKFGIKTLAICYDEKVEKLAIDAQIPYLSMLANEDYDIEFKKMMAINVDRIVEFSKAKHFDWEKIEELIKNS